jgi:hypothetical protein
MLPSSAQAVEGSVDRGLMDAADSFIFDSGRLRFSSKIPPASG